MERSVVSIYEMMPLIQEQLLTGSVSFLVRGTSMTPFLIDNETTVTLTSVQRKLKRKDIVFYCVDGKYILHRILRVKKNKFIICGDALRRLEVVPKEAVFAVVADFKYHEKVTSVNNLWYRIKVGLWLFLRPFRKILIAMYVRRMKVDRKK